MGSHLLRVGVHFEESFDQGVIPPLRACLAESFEFEMTDTVNLSREPSRFYFILFLEGLLLKIGLIIFMPDLRESVFEINREPNSYPPTGKPVKLN